MKYYFPTSFRQQKREKTPDPLLSPSSKKKGKKIEMTSTPMSVPGKKPQAPQQIEDTVFFLPSIDLKVRVNRLKVISCRVRNESKPSKYHFEFYDMYVCFIFGHNKLFNIVLLLIFLSIFYLHVHELSGALQFQNS